MRALVTAATRRLRRDREPANDPGVAHQVSGGSQSHTLQIRSGRKHIVLWNLSAI